MKFIKALYGNNIHCNSRVTTSLAVGNVLGIENGLSDMLLMWDYLLMCEISSNFFLNPYTIIFVHSGFAQS